MAGSACRTRLFTPAHRSLDLASILLYALLLATVCSASTQVQARAANPTSVAARWKSSLAKASALVKQMTTQEMNNITVGMLNSANGCGGIAGSVPRLGYPELCVNDAGNGLRATDLVNAYPAGVSVGASWNVALAHDRGLYMGAEFRRKGVAVLLGPVVSPLGRTALGGRNWEGFGADPLLAGKLVAASVQGMQQSVITTTKHWIGYEQETNRQKSGNLQSYSSNINDQDLHEIYMWPFQDAVYAGTTAIMSSYNRINEVYASQDGPTVNDLLKSELGFPGFVMSDFYAQHSGVQSALGGLDMAMPLSYGYWTGILTTAVQNGSLPASRLQDMATRIVAAWYQVFDGKPLPVAPGAGMPKNLLVPYKPVEGRDPASKATRLNAAIEGHVLVKNVKNALPLKQPKILSLFGYDATVPSVNNPISTLVFADWALGLQPVEVSTGTIIAIGLGNQSVTVPEAGYNGTEIVGVGSGANTPPYIGDPYSAFQEQAYQDDTYLFWDFDSFTPSVNPMSDACLVFINEDSSEGVDRPGLADSNSDTLVKNVAAKCQNTMVIMHNAGIRLVDAWIDHPNVTAAIYAHLPGQDSGRALLSVLYGKVSPSGRLPYTVARTASDYGPLLKPVQPDYATNTSAQINFSAPSYIDYKYFRSQGITPRFAFGYGLTYSTFAYSGVHAAWSAGVPPASPPNPTATIPGGIASLFDTVATVSFSLNNTGAAAAAEVPQVYVQFPGDPVPHLRGFDKVLLQPGEAQTVQIALTRRELSRWDAAAKQWSMPAGTYHILVAASAVDVKLRATLAR